MEDPDHSDLVERYRSLPDEELLRLVDQRADLRPMAQMALDQEAGRRRVPMKALRQVPRENRTVDGVELERQIHEKKRRKAHRFHWYLVLFVPLLLFLIVGESLGMFEATAGRIGSLVVVFALCWLGLAIWKHCSSAIATNTAGDA